MPSAPGYMPRRPAASASAVRFAAFKGRQRDEKISAAGWILFVVLLVMCIPLCWLPFVVNGCKRRTPLPRLWQPGGLRACRAA